MNDHALFEMFDNDGEAARTATICNLAGSIAGAALELIRIIDEPIKEREPDQVQPKDINTFLHVTDGSFREDYRMNRTVFERLYTTVAPLVERSQQCKVDPRIQLMMTLWIMASPDSFRSVGKKFGYNRGTVHYVYVKHIRAINQLAAEFIRWPSHQQMQGIMHRFQQKGPFPRVIGSLDGSRIVIHKPVKNPVAFYDRKGQYSIQLQAVCDESLQFRDIYVGECGSIHDALVLQRSPLFELLNDDNALPDDCHIVADAAYGLRKNIMVPYKRLNRNDLTARQKNYNYALSKSRIVIENAFARLKTKWRSLLDKLDVLRIDYGVWHIVAACILHNFIIREGQSFPEPDEAEVMRAERLDNRNADNNYSDDDDDEEGDGDFDNPHVDEGFVDGERVPRRNNRRNVAVRKRDEIALHLPVLARPERAVV